MIGRKVKGKWSLICWVLLMLIKLNTSALINPFLCVNDSETLLCRNVANKKIWDASWLLPEGKLLLSTYIFTSMFMDTDIMSGILSNKKVLKVLLYWLPFGFFLTWGPLWSPGSSSLYCYRFVTKLDCALFTVLLSLRLQWVGESPVWREPQ